jgi:hypothetical protein
MTGGEEMTLSASTATFCGWPLPLFGNSNWIGSGQGN